MSDETRPPTGASQRGRPTWPGGVAVLVIVHGPWALAVFGGFVDSHAGRPIAAALVVLGATAYAVMRLTGRALGIDRRSFGDHFPIQDTAFLWTIGTRLVDAANGRREGAELTSVRNRR